MSETPTTATDPEQPAPTAPTAPSAPGPDLSIDYDTPLGTVRLLASDTSTDPLLDDDQLRRLLKLEGIGTATAAAPDEEGAHTRGCKLAAAHALEVVAASEALVGKAIRTQDLTTDGTKVAAELRQRAAGLRAQVQHDDDVELGGFFSVAEFGRY